MEADLTTIKDWFKANKLTLNIEKTVVLWFKNGICSIDSIETIKLESMTLECAMFCKFLGLWIDKNLNWKEHVKRLVLKLTSRKSLLSRGKHFLTVHAKKVLYHAQIQSNLTYGLLIWGNMISCEDKQKLQKIQDKCVQLIDLKKSVDNIYREHKILKLSQLIELENCKVWYKHYHSMLPTKLSKLMGEDHRGISLNKKHGYQTRKKSEINSPLATANRYRSSFFVKGLQVYSKLPTEIKKEPNLNRFVTHCKRYLIENN